MLQLRLQEIGLVLERLFLEFRVGILIWRSIPSATNPTWKSGGVKPIPPPAAAATASETHPEPSSGDGVHISRHSKTSAVSGCASAHWSHSQWACPISSWHDFPPFMSSGSFICCLFCRSQSRVRGPDPLLCRRLGPGFLVHRGFVCLGLRNGPFRVLFPGLCPRGRFRLYLASNSPPFLWFFIIFFSDGGSRKRSGCFSICLADTF